MTKGGSNPLFGEQSRPKIQPLPIRKGGVSPGSSTQVLPLPVGKMLHQLHVDKKRSADCELETYMETISVGTPQTAGIAMLTRGPTRVQMQMCQR